MGPETWQVGDRVLAVKGANLQRNRSFGHVEAVHKSGRKITDKPLGAFNVGCCFICNIIFCGMCDFKDQYMYDVRYEDGVFEEKVPAKFVFDPTSPKSPVLQQSNEEKEVFN